MLGAFGALPILEHFPDQFDRSEAALDAIFRRVANYMNVDPDTIELTLFEEGAETSRSFVPYASGRSAGAGGLYRHMPEEKTEISINTSKLADPMALVATLAHELGHVILLRPGLVDGGEEDMEPLNDLLTVYLGFGVFNANAAFQFSQYTNNETQGWSARRLGYLSEQLFGYALARFAFERKERKPDWATHLTTNVATYFKRSSAWLRANGNSLPLGRD